MISEAEAKAIQERSVVLFLHAQGIGWDVWVSSGTQSGTDEEEGWFDLSGECLAHYGHTYAAVGPGQKKHKAGFREALKRAASRLTRAELEEILATKK